jgi:integration host factor subunit alpha
MTFTKADIVDAITETNGFTKKKAIETVETLIETIKRSLEAGDDVLISGFGKFSVNIKKERRGRNPATGQKMMLKPRRVVTFKCSGKLRDKVNR